MKSPLSRILIYTLLLLGAGVFAMPLMWMVMTALKPADQAMSNPPTWVPHRWYVDMGDQRVQGLAVLRGRTAGGAKVRAQHQRHIQLATRHVVGLGRLIAELVHDQKQEVAEHQVHHRAASGHGGPDGDAHETGFGDRRVDDARGAEFLDQTGCADNKERYLTRLFPRRDADRAADIRLCGKV